MARSSGGPSGRHLSKQEWHRRFVVAIFLERNDEWAGGSGPRYMRLETIAPMIYDSSLARGGKLMPSNGSEWCRKTTGHDREAVAHKGARMSEQLGIARGACEGM